MKAEKGPSRSPLKDRPLRNPGQSVEEARRKLVEDRIETPGLLAVLLITVAALEWWRYFSNSPPQPVLFSLVAVLAAIFTTWRIWRVRPQLRSMRLGIEGEKAVGQFLESLRERGYKVFHDLVSDGFNLDHVIVGPAGVFTIETKTWSKPVRGEPRIDFDGMTLTVAGRQPDRDPVIQAKAQASWLQRIVKESTGRQVTVRPVIVFPGWFIKQPQGSTREIWVLEPKALPRFLEHEATRLSAEDVQLISYHLSRHIRASEAQSAWP